VSNSRVVAPSATCHTSRARRGPIRQAILSRASSPKIRGTVRLRQTQAPPSPMYRAHQSTVVRPHVSCATYETERFLEGAAVNQSPNRTSRHPLLRLALLDCCVSSKSRRVVIGQILAQLTTKYVPMMVADLISCSHGNQGLFTTTKGVACMSLRRFARYLHRSHTSGLSECQISRTPSSKNGLMC
jgi:hypothetical protein